MSEKIVLIDGHSILHRAYFGMPPLTTAEGIPTNAVFGFIKMMLNFLEDEKPEYFAVAFDVHAKTFRHDLFTEYKGTRKPMEDDLRSQVTLMKEVLRSMDVPILEKEGYEADDILGTVAHRMEEKGLDVRIISGDRDLLQLATEKICIRIPKTKKGTTTVENYFAKDVEEAYGVTPLEFIEVKALQGDSSDNIPGIPGVGEKTAQALIAQYHTVENVYKHREEVKPKKAQESITNHYELALLCKKLATILLEAPIDFNLEDAALKDGTQSLFTQEAYTWFKKLEFKNLLGRFENQPSKEQNSPYKKVNSFEEMKKIAEAGKKKAGVAVFGNHVAIIADETLGGIYGCASKEEKDQLLESLIHGACKLVTMDAKAFMKELTNEQIATLKQKDALEDVTLAAYLVNPLLGDYPYDYFASEYLGKMVPSEEELVGKGKKREEEESSKMYECQMLALECAYQAFPAVYNKLVEFREEKVYREIELPLSYCLDEMEKEGIAVNRQALKEYGDSLVNRIDELERSIYEQAGEEFNINSPKQLGVILFEKLNMPNGKKTKTGYSTAADVLENLAGEYPIVSDILEYRQLTKLKSTYADGLADYISEDGRIHGTFNQTITATGRISSTEPNLQNIPIRLELGRQIRKVFVPKPGYCFVDADYSQIELRLLAHMSGDENLIKAYNSGEDIHRMTASMVFKVPFEEVTEQLRRNAKAVNFGIVYGISAFGLAQDLNISNKEAKEYIEGYFATYPGVKNYLEGLKDSAKEKGYCETLFNRRRPVPELSSGNFMQRSFGERVAMNAPIQGTAADVMKIAMIKVANRLKETGVDAKILVQVHDELLLECKIDQKEAVRKLVEEEMEAAANLSVKLEVDAHDGNDWYEAK